MSYYLVYRHCLLVCMCVCVCVCMDVYRYNNFLCVCNYIVVCKTQFVYIIMVEWKKRSSDLNSAIINKA